MSGGAPADRDLPGARSDRAQPRVRLARRASPAGLARIAALAGIVDVLMSRNYACSACTRSRESCPAPPPSVCPADDHQTGRSGIKVVSEPGLTPVLKPEGRAMFGTHRCVLGSYSSISHRSRFPCRKISRAASETTRRPRGVNPTSS